MTTEKGTGKGKATSATENLVELTPFLLLGLDLPAAPLFKDVLEKNIIPQVRVHSCDHHHHVIEKGQHAYREEQHPAGACALVSSSSPSSSWLSR